jgi:Zn-dependent peptidase ImmA (M78 family)
MTKTQRVARPRSRDEIEELAWRARAALGLRPYDKVPVAKILERVVPELIREFELRVVDHGRLGDAEAITDFAKPIITFDVRVYDEMCRNAPRARMTGLHELGHLLLHTGQTGLAFMPRYDPRMDLEKQANIFAASFMMPECAFKQVRSIKEVMSRFGVSRDAACFRARTLKMQWLVKGDTAPRRHKKKGYSKSRTP